MGDERLDAFRVALDFAAMIPALTKAARPALRDQLERAASSPRETLDAPVGTAITSSRWLKGPRWSAPWPKARLRARHRHPPRDRAPRRRRRTIQALPRSIVVELAALDGAMVLSNQGRLLAYGAVLQPKKRGRIAAEEGSRTKAAVGTSHYGLAVKVSSDGDLGVFVDGDEFLSV